MPSWLGLPAAPTLSVEFDELDNNIFFLYPGPERKDDFGNPRRGELSNEADLAPVADTNVEGRVILDLPVAKKVKRVSVQLIGLQRFRFREKDVCVETLRRELDLKIDEEELPAGRHEFAFSIHVPANIAPSLQSEVGTTRYRLYATIPKLGRLGGDLQTVRKVGLQVNHSGQLNGPPPAHHYETQFLHDRFGPSLFEMSAKHLIIGGYLRYYITWHAYLLPFKIIDLTIDVVQHIRIKPSLDVVEPVEKQVQRRTIYRLKDDYDVYSKIDEPFKPGDEYTKVSRQIRIPYDEGPYIHATDHPDTQSCISATSELVMSLTFEQYEGGEKPTPEQLSKPSRQLLQIKCPAVFSSCFCKLSHFKLPAYTPSDDLSLSRQSSSRSGKGKYGMTQCLCVELDEAEEKEYGVSREEVHERWKAEETGLAWLEAIKQKADQHPSAP